MWGPDSRDSQLSQIHVGLPLHQDWTGRGVLRLGTLAHVKFEEYDRLAALH